MSIRACNVDVTDLHHDVNKLTCEMFFFCPMGLKVVSEHFLFVISYCPPLLIKVLHKLKS